MVQMRFLSALACCWGLASCTATDLGPGGARTSVTGAELAVDLSARQPGAQTGSSGPVVGADRSTGRTFNFGPEDPVTTASASSRLADAGGVGGGADAGPDGGYRLNFERADIKDVVRAVLNDALGLSYTMSADVAGQVTVSSVRPLGRTELLSVLENLLAGQGLSMTKVGGGYRIAANGVGGGSVDYGVAARPGYGVSIVPLRHVSVGVMSRLVSGFVTDADGFRFDATRNTMILRGPGAKRQEAVEAILAFDADWMQGQSVSLFEVKRARPEAVVTELTQIFDSGEAGGSAGVIQFKPVARLRAVMAVSRNPALIKRAETFVRRLDRESGGAAENVFVYRARYRDAKELARVVSTLFAAGGDAKSLGAAGGEKNRRPGSQESEGGRGSGGLSGSGGSSSGGSMGGSGGGSSGGGSSSGGGQSASSSTDGRQWANRFSAAFDEKSGRGGGAEGGAPDLVDLSRKQEAGATRITVSADLSNNSVVTYTDGETYRKVEATLRQLDSTPLQVAVNVTIAEVQLNDALRFGIQYFATSEKVGLGKDNGSVGLFSQTASIAADVIQKQIPGFNFVSGSKGTPDIILNALDSITDVKVLSSPSLVVLENKTATLQVGDAIPITTRQSQSIENNNAPLINQVEFRDTGIILNVTPRIGQNDAVTMEIEQEISSVTAAGNTLTPTISKRKVASSISVVSGQTVLLAGLIAEKTEKGRSGIPFLGRIPVLGDLFSDTNNGAGRTELVVFIRPVVIRSGEDAQSVAQEFRSRMQMVGIQQPRPRAFKPLVDKD